MEHYVRVLNIGMVTEDSLPTLSSNTVLHRSEWAPSPIKPKLTGATAAKRNRNPKSSVNRTKASASRPQLETSAEAGESINSNEQSLDHDPRVSATFKQPEISNLSKRSVIKA